MHWRTSCRVEKSWPNIPDLKILFQSPLFEVPVNYRYNTIRLISDLNLVDRESIQKTTLSCRFAIIVVLNIVMVAEVIRGVEKLFSHSKVKLIYIKLTEVKNL